LAKLVVSAAETTGALRRTDGGDAAPTAVITAPYAGAMNEILLQTIAGMVASIMLFFLRCAAAWLAQFLRPIPAR
jgi:hypothetical protein